MTADLSMSETAMRPESATVRSISARKFETTADQPEADLATGISHFSDV